VVALVSVAQGATKGISNQLNALGTNLLTVSPGFFPAARPRRGSFGSATTPHHRRRQRHLRPVRVGYVAPELTTSKLVIAGTQNETARIIGTTPGIPAGLRLRHVDRLLYQPGLGR